MPETQDTKNTTDQGRSGGAQTQKTAREGQGSSEQTNPSGGIQNRDEPGQGMGGGYGSPSNPAERAADSPAANVEPDNSIESGGPDGQYTQETKRRVAAMDSSHTETSAQEWSPGSDQPNT